MKAIKTRVNKLNSTDLKVLQEYINKRIKILVNEEIIKICKEKNIVFENIENICYEYNMADYIHEINCSCTIDGIEFTMYCYGDREMMTPIIKTHNIELIDFYVESLCFIDDDDSDDDDGDIETKNMIYKYMEPLIKKYNMSLMDVIYKVHSVFKIICDVS